MAKSEIKEPLKEDLLAMRYRPALAATGVFAAAFLICTIGSILGGQSGHVLVIVASLPLSLFVMPLLDTIEDPAAFAMVLYGLNFIFGALFWFVSVVVMSNVRMFLEKKKLDYLLVAVIATVVLLAFVFKELRGYGFFLGLNGAVSWKDGVPRKRVFSSAVSGPGDSMVSGAGWLAHYHNGKWVHFKVPGKSRRIAWSMVSTGDESFYAKYGQDVFQITHKNWKRMPIKRSSGALAINKAGEVTLLSADGISVLRNGVFEEIGAVAECVPGESRVFADSHGELWTGGKLGSMACVFDGKKLSVVRVAGAGEDEPAQDSARAFAEDKSGRVWFGTEGGDVYRVDDGVARQIRFVRPMNPGKVTSLLFDPDGNLLLTYENAGLFIMRSQDGFITQVDLPGADHLHHLCCLARDGSGAIWVGHGHGLLKYSGPKAVSEAKPAVR
ncbi:MAG: two-component regulator propeller domain-containing protein [Myxococcota bacterium]